MMDRLKDMVIDFLTQYEDILAYMVIGIIGMAFLKIVMMLA